MIAIHLRGLSLINVCIRCSKWPERSNECLRLFETGTSFIIQIVLPGISIRYNDKTVVRPSYPSNGNSCNIETTYSYRDGPLDGARADEFLFRIRWRFLHWNAHYVSYGKPWPAYPRFSGFRCCYVIMTASEATLNDMFKLSSVKM